MPLIKSVLTVNHESCFDESEEERRKEKVSRYRKTIQNVKNRTGTALERRCRPKGRMTDKDSTLVFGYMSLPRHRLKISF